MALATIYPNGVNEITVPATESIAISNFGGGIAKIYYLIDQPNYPPSYQLQQTLEDSSVTLGAFTTETIVKIEAGASKVVYDVATAPDTGIGDADTLGGELPSYYAADSTVAHLAGTETISGAKTFSTSPILNNNRYLRIKEAGGTARDIVGVTGGDVVIIGNAALEANISSDGTVNIVSANLVIANNKYIRLTESGATIRDILGITGADVLVIGNAALPTNILSNGTLQYNGATLASGTIDTTATQTITVVDGLITSIA